MKRWIGYEQGVNLGGWLSQCIHTREHYDTFITEDDFKVISNWNIDHVRVPVDYNLVETEDGVYNENGFGYIENCINWCRKYHLNMILDLHKTAGYSFDAGEKESGFFESAKYQERFYRLWEEFAIRFGDNKDILAFELLNEIVDKSVCRKWNKISYKCISRIRKIAPDIKILIGGYWNNSAASVKDLAEPYDKNVVFNFHCYDPLVFTHQGAYWVNGMPIDFRCRFDGTVNDMKELAAKVLADRPEGFDGIKDLNQKIGTEYFMELFKDAYEAAEKAGVMLYCGEYGVIEQTDRNEALKWFAAIHEAFDRYHIGHAAWNYKKMDFDIKGKNMKVIFDKDLSSDQDENLEVV